MYHYLDDKEFLHDMRKLSGALMQSLCHHLKQDYDISANFYLVGSGARNLILQNADQPVDLDYNLEIVRCGKLDDCRYIKECAIKSFNKALREKHLGNCEDSTSSLTAKKIHITSGNQTEFSIDVCITKRDASGQYYRLIHHKTGFTYYDTYYWTPAPQSDKIREKADYIKKHGQWDLVREQYLKIKNRYLMWNDHHHPSFVCYVEVINNVYNSRPSWQGGI